MRWINENPTSLEEFDGFYLLHGGEVISERMIGTISNIAIRGLPRSDKPLIAYSFVRDESIVKVSARGTAETVKMGINLGELMKETAEKLSGLGGGHNIAAGAQIPKERLGEFIDALKKALARR